MICKKAIIDNWKRGYSKKWLVAEYKEYLTENNLFPKEIKNHTRYTQIEVEKVLLEDYMNNLKNKDKK